jgi:plastocyanin
MWAGNALVVTGIVTVVAGLSGPGIAAESDPAAPADSVDAVEEPGAGALAPVEEAGPAELGAEEGRVPEEADAEPVATDDEDGRDGSRSEGRGERERERDKPADEAKQPRANVDVQMKNIQFNPKNITVSPGDEVTWRNQDTAQHDARADDGSFETPLLEKGETAKVPFNDEGTFDYFCSVHPTMTGTVVVGSGGGGGGGDKDDTASTGTGGTGTTFDGSTGTGSSASTGTFSSGGSSSGSGGSLPNTGGVELPLLLLGSGLLVAGLLARAFHEYWIWR